MPTMIAVINGLLRLTAKCLSSLAQNLSMDTLIPFANVPTGFRLREDPSIGFLSCLRHRARTFSATWRAG